MSSISKCWFLTEERLCQSFFAGSRTVVEQTTIETALDRAMEMSFSEFEGQVLECLFLKESGSRRYLNSSCQKTFPSQPFRNG